MGKLSNAKVVMTPRSSSYRESPKMYSMNDKMLAKMSTPVHLGKEAN